MKFFSSLKNDVMSNPNENPKPPKGLLYEKIMKATHEYNETVAARRLAKLAKIYPSLTN
jgi:hypothetical protein